MSAYDIELSDGRTTSRARKVRTPNGERIEFTSAETSQTIRLDPLELESLTWISAVPTGPTGEVLPTEETAVSGLDRGDPVKIGNEYTVVGLSVIGGTYLEITSHKLGDSVVFDASAVEKICEFDKDVFSRLLETPFGP